MLLPEVVHLRQRDVPLDLPRELPLHRVKFPLLGREHRLHLPDHYLAHRLLPPHHLRLRQLDPLEELLQLGDQPRGIHRGLVLEVVRDDLIRGLDRVVQHLIGQPGVIVHHKPAADDVRGLALGAEDLVVLEHLLADPVEVLLHVLLHFVQRRRHRLGLERHVLLHAQRLEQRLDAARPEHLEQLVIKRQEEARAAWVALAASASPKLLVDAPRFVPLRADHVQPPKFLHLGLLLGAAFVEHALGRQVRRAQQIHVRVRRHRAGLRGDSQHRIELLHVLHLPHLFLGLSHRGVDRRVRLVSEFRQRDACRVLHDLHPLLRREPVRFAEQRGRELLHDALLREESGVAAEEDVGTTRGHVGRDRDRERAPRLSDDLRLALDVLGLGVEDLVRHLELGKDAVEVLRGLD
mmetsp:Transcript_47732/g.113605  ORF Transcript_47732/g.113605 Transcript_47732/m.113605 type:complete len:407 (+) Transcript_47732:288-1508(+)